MDNLIEFRFRGEESARFARFATEIIEVFGSNCIDVKLVGREPMTSKYISVDGKVAGALNEGYRRHVEISENGTDLQYWAAGTNATGSVATKEITFYLTNDQKVQLKMKAQEKGWFVPLFAHDLKMNEEWCIVDNAVKDINIANANCLINMIDMSTDIDLLREVGLALRSYADFLSHNIKLMKQCEKKACSLVDELIDSEPRYRDVRIAFIELIGYTGESGLKAIRTLMNQIKNTTDTHVIWASIIALGRINNDRKVLSALLEIKEIIKNQKIDGNARQKADVKDSEWVDAALLLCIARRVVEISDTKLQADLENFFRSYFTFENHVLHRYACLGLSQLDRLTPETVEQLIVQMEDESSNIIDKGYYTMALLPMLRTELSIKKANSQSYGILQDTQRARLKKVITECTEENIQRILKGAEPDAIWGLENLADLALEIEDNELASDLHSSLSELFEDWRYSYYKALQLYEKAEINISRNRKYEHIHNGFEYALKTIDEMHENDPYASSIIEFRGTIIKARLCLFEVTNEWLTATDSMAVSVLKKKLKEEVINRFNQYLVSPTNQGISTREISNIKETCLILSIIEKILTLNERVLDNYSDNSEVISRLITEIVVTILQSQGEFSRGHAEVLRYIYNLFDELKSNKQTDYEKVLNVLHEVAEHVSKITWTMPAQMCLLNGLGKGSIRLIKEEITGEGTKENPYLLSSISNDKYNIKLSIQLEVSTGATIQTAVWCDTLNKPEVLHGIVEGTAITSFVIPSVLVSKDMPFPFTFHLEFSTNGIIQKSGYMYCYFKVR